MAAWTTFLYPSRKERKINKCLSFCNVPILLGYMYGVLTKLERYPWRALGEQIVARGACITCIDNWMFTMLDRVTPALQKLRAFVSCDIRFTTNCYFANTRVYSQSNQLQNVLKTGLMLNSSNNNNAFTHSFKSVS